MFINFHLGPKVNKNLCIFSYLNMFILINIYFVGHVYTLFGVGEEAYLRQVVKGVVSLFRGVLLLGGYVYLFLMHCPGGTSIREGMFIWHYRVSKI